MPSSGSNVEKRFRVLWLSHLLCFRSS